MHRSLIKILLGIASLLVACKGSSISNDLLTTDFSGTWEVEYSIIVDECGLAPDNSLDFVDEQTISQTEDFIVLTSANLSTNEYLGQLRPDASFEVESSEQGDLFGNGTECTLTDRLSYTPVLTENDSRDWSSSLYELRLTCSDGLNCVSTLKGQAQRIQ